MVSFAVGERKMGGVRKMDGVWKMFIVILGLSVIVGCNCKPTKGKNRNFPYNRRLTMHEVNEHFQFHVIPSHVKCGDKIVASFSTKR